MDLRSVVKMGTGTKGTGTRVGSGMAKKRLRSARNRSIVVDAKGETGETLVERGRDVEKEVSVQ